MSKDAVLTSDVDVAVALASLLKDPRLVAKNLHVYKTRDKPECVIKPKVYLGLETWRIINSWVRGNGGNWHRKEGLWTVPLQRR